jgi:site-specific DNA recombinase
MLIPATEIEALVAQTVGNHIKPTEPIDDRSLVDAHVARVEVQPDRLVIPLVKGAKAKPNGNTATADRILQVPWQKTATRRREILLPDRVPAEQVRPMRSETRAKLVASLARGRRWLDELTRDPAASAETIAKREGCSARKVNMTISLAFLAPDLVKAAIEGRLPHGIGTTRLTDLPAEWSRQHEMLGLPSQ